MILSFAVVTDPFAERMSAGIKHNRNQLNNPFDHMYHKKREIKIAVYRGMTWSDDTFSYLVTRRALGVPPQWKLTRCRLGSCLDKTSAKTEEVTFTDTKIRRLYGQWIAQRAFDDTALRGGVPAPQQHHHFAPRPARLYPLYLVLFGRHVPA
jgi:hypothetical protein